MKKSTTTAELRPAAVKEIERREDEGLVALCEARAADGSAGIPFEEVVAELKRDGLL